MTTPSVSPSRQTLPQPMITRADAIWVLGHAGFDVADLADLLDDVDFPTTLDDVMARGQRRGITRNALVERLGGSP